MSTTSASVKTAHGAGEIRALIASLYEPGRVRPKLAYGISNMDVLETHFPEYAFSSGNTARLAAGVPSHYIYTSTKGRAYSGSDHVLNRVSRYLPVEQLGPVGDITIVADTVVFISEEAGHLTACSIENPHIANQMRGVFEFLWSRAR